MLMITLFSYGQTHESFFRSLSVNGNTAILLEWMIPDGINSSNFVSYNIYHSEDYAGPYEYIYEGTVYNNPQFLHQPPGGTSIQHYYFITTQQTAGDSITSDTLTHVRLNVSRYNSNSTARLSWNHIKDEPFLYNYQYEIHRIIEGGADETIAVTGDSEYYDLSFHNCTDKTITYYLRQTDPLSTLSALSTEDADIFRDITQPVIPNVKSVTVINNSQVKISWDSSPDTDVAEYRVYENRPPGLDWNYLFSVFGTDTTFAGTNICDGEINYAVSAMDFCGNEDPPDYQFAHRVLDLEIIEPDICDQTVFFDWSDYINMNPPLQGYNIIEVDLNTGAETLKATTTNSEFTLDESFTDGEEYCFYVEAFNSAGYSSTSCTQCITGYIPISPDTLSVTNISVVAPAVIDIEWYIDADANESTLYRLLREDISTGSQNLIREAAPSDGPELFFLDENVDTDNETYRYFSETIDTCGNLMPYFPEAKTFLLSGQSLVPGVYNLTWSEAFNSSSTLQEYIIIRTIGSDTDTVYRGSALSVTDQITDPVVAAGEAEFVALARYIDSNTGAEHLSFSNRITLTAELKMLNFPNAFTPDSDGLNDTFGPINFLNDQNVAGYKLSIYDRWGKNIYTSTSYDNRWDGTSDGSAVPAGIYVFHVVLTTPQGTEFTRRGTVALIK